MSPRPGNSLGIRSANWRCCLWHCYKLRTKFIILVSKKKVGQANDLKKKTPKTCRRDVTTYNEEENLVFKRGWWSKRLYWTLFSNHVFEKRTNNSGISRANGFKISALTHLAILFTERYLGIKFGCGVYRDRPVVNIKIVYKQQSINLLYSISYLKSFDSAVIT